MAHRCHCHQNPGKTMATKKKLAKRTLSIIARTFETLEDGRVPAQWLPRLTDVQHHGRGISGHVPEYGCGAYGCVFPTLDPNVVLKITEDDTEAEFAGSWSRVISRPVTVTYHEVITIDPSFTEYPTFLLWREAASHVGDLTSMVADRDGALQLVNIQHEAAERAYNLMRDHPQETEEISHAAQIWLATCDQMATQSDVPELQEVGAGMAAVFRENKVFFGDIHLGNLGLVTRAGVDHWVITDPGHVAVIDF